MANLCESALPLTPYEGDCKANPEDAGRAIREVLDRIGTKWSLLIVATLDSRTLRYSELLSHIPGISQRMLTLTLRQLERDGLVKRETFGEVPPRVEYSLTEMGRTLIGPVSSLAVWAVDHHPLIEQSRAVYDAAV